MLKVKNLLRKYDIYALCACLFAVILQVQISLFAHDTYLGLRVNLADLLIPFIGISILVSLILKRTYWPQFHVRHIWYWLVGLVLVMTTGLVNGYFANGFLSVWALVNKYVGFYLLLSYFALGAWLASNTQNLRHLVRIMALGFVSFFVGVVLLLTCMSLVVLIPDVYIDYFWGPWRGFMGNRNALMLVYLVAFLFVIHSYTNKEIYLPFWLCQAFWLMLPVFMVFNASRAGWIATALLGVYFFVKDPFKRFKAVIIALLVGTVFAGCLMHFSNQSYVRNKDSYRYLKEAVLHGENAIGQTNRVRYITFEDATEMYKQSNPIIGAGLGHYKEFQLEKRGEFIEVIDFTGLWLLSEMGVLGLFVFSAFFLTCLYRLYVLGYRQGEDYLALHRVMFVFLLLFALISLVHEQLYARFMWFIMGVALAVPMTNQSAPKPN